jgi:hypothetical protein
MQQDLKDFEITGGGLMVPILPGVALKPEDVLVVPDQHKQKYYMSFV